MTRQDARQKRQPGGVPRMQRKMPQINSGGIDNTRQHSLEYHQHDCHRRPREELANQEAERGGLDGLASRAQADAQPDDGAGEKANGRGRRHPAEQQQCARRRAPAELDGQGAGKHCRPGREETQRDRGRPEELRRLRRGRAPIQHGTDQQKNRDPGDGEDDSGNAATPPRPCRIEIGRGHRDFHERLTAWRVQEECVRAWLIARSLPSHPQRRGAQWCLEEIVARRDRRGCGRGGQHVLGRDRADAMLIGSEDWQDVHQAQAQRGWGHEERCRSRQPIGHPNVRGASNPRQRVAGGVVDRQRHRVGRGPDFGQPPIDELEEIASRVRPGHESS